MHTVIIVFDIILLLLFIFNIFLTIHLFLKSKDRKERILAAVAFLFTTIGLISDILELFHGW